MPEMSRRAALRMFGGFSAAAALAACTRRDSKEPPLPPLPDKSGKVTVATWPLYIDQDVQTKRRPSVDAFTKRTGVTVDLQENLTDADAFVKDLRITAAAGDTPAWDVAVMPNRLVPRMAEAGLLERLHHDALPNFSAFAGAPFIGPAYDRGNRYSLAWQAGITGIGYDPNLTKRPINKIGDLFDPAFAGRVGLSSEMLDTMSLALLHLGIEPATASVKDARAARELLVGARPAIRSYYGSDAVQALARGDVALTMAWSSDIFQVQADNPELVFVVPDDGAILWSDDMVILKGAEHPTDAHLWMDNYYDPIAAAMVAERINYLSPVPSSRSVMLDRAAKLKDADERADLERIANSSLMFPTDQAFARCRRYPVLTEDDERTWGDLFQEAVTA